MSTIPNVAIVSGLNYEGERAVAAQLAVSKELAEFLTGKTESSNDQPCRSTAEAGRAGAERTSRAGMPLSAAGSALFRDMGGAVKRAPKSASVLYALPSRKKVDAALLGEVSVVVEAGGAGAIVATYGGALASEAYKNSRVANALLLSTVGALFLSSDVARGAGRAAQYFADLAARSMADAGREKVTRTVAGGALRNSMR